MDREPINRKIGISGKDPAGAWTAADRSLESEFTLPALLSAQEHLDACKERALAHARAGRVAEALALFLTQMERHPGTALHESLRRGLRLFAERELNTPEAMEQFLLGVS